MLPPNGRHPGGRRSPRLARTSAAAAATSVAEILSLEASTPELTRRAAPTDPGAGAMMVPYAGRVAVATALNTAIARRNPGGQPWKEGQP